MQNLKINPTPSSITQYRIKNNSSNPSFKKQPTENSKNLELSTKAENNNKTLLVFAGLALVTLAGVLGTRAYRNNYINKAQKTFQEVFMRDSISKKETIEMLKRYKEISKIKNKEEYINELFKEVKKNYGFEKGCLELNIYSPKEKEFVAGSVKKLKHIVNINKERTPIEILNTMHHEMKHKQQEYFMMNYSGSLKEFIKNISPIPLNKKDLSKEYLEEMIKNNPKWLEQFNLRELDKNLVPEKYKEYVEKLLKDVKTYKEAEHVNGKINKEYYENFLEIDARNAGSKIEKLFNSFIQ